MPQISVQNLAKTYHVPEREPGLIAAIKALRQRKYRDVEAVRGVSFTVEAGEIVGFLGPNGAGKTTTLKMLSGLLYPTGGSVQIDGDIPWTRSHTYLRKISMVMGNRSQMMWDIPPMDTFIILREIYNVPTQTFKRTLDDLVDLLEMHDLLTKPVRNMSLGERMKCELVAALLHQPRVLFMDEPTLGLDISMQLRLRKFVADYNRTRGATVILTSHYMADVVELCPRVILIHRGQLLYDGLLSGLVEKLAPFKLVRVSLREDGETARFPNGVEVVESKGHHVLLRVGRAEVPELTAHLLAALPVVDLTVEDPPVDSVIDQVYREGAA